MEVYLIGGMMHADPVMQALCLPSVSTRDAPTL